MPVNLPDLAFARISKAFVERLVQSCQSGMLGACDYYLLRLATGLGWYIWVSGCQVYREFDQPYVWSLTPSWYSLYGTYADSPVFSALYGSRTEPGSRSRYVPYVPPRGLIFGSYPAVYYVTCKIPKPIFGFRVPGFRGLGYTTFPTFCHWFQMN